jgi:hypothetical protein
MILVFVFIFESSFSLPESLIIKSLNPASGHLAIMNGKKREVGGFFNQYCGNKNTRPQYAPNRLGLRVQASQKI